MGGIWGQSASWEVLPKKQCLFSLLPGQTVTVILKLTFPPVKTTKHTYKRTRMKESLKQDVWETEPSQLGQHSLHLLVDLIGRRSEALLLFNHAHVAFRGADGFVALAPVDRQRGLFTPETQRRLVVRNLRRNVSKSSSEKSLSCKFTNRIDRDGELYFPSGYLVHLDHILTVPLLGYITQASGDVDPAADVHVHFHGFLLDFTVQLGQILQKTKSS